MVKERQMGAMGPLMGMSMKKKNLKVKLTEVLLIK